MGVCDIPGDILELSEKCQKPNRIVSRPRLCVQHKGYAESRFASPKGLFRDFLLKVVCGVGA